SWTPPADTSGIDRYYVYIASDEQKTQSAQLWNSDPTEEYVPVGTNEMNLYNNPERTVGGTTPPPANWLIVLGYKEAGLIFSEVSAAAKIPLVDVCNDIDPPAPQLSSLTFENLADVVGQVEGTVEFTLTANDQDLGLTAEFEVFVVEEGPGSADDLSVGKLPRGTNQLVIPA
ncbi:unnamed protein product, partial [Polarella glacialis]